jgi:hypothetical protein
MIPPKHNGAFAAAMESLLRVYARPVDPRFPVVCLDEAGKELQAFTREPLPMTAGRPRREDSEVQRLGYAALFLWVAPFQGQRQITVRPRRTKHDFALVLRDLVAAFPGAERITLVVDNLNIHTPGALYETFPPEEAAAIHARLEWIHTPLHGSWLNLAEQEWSALRRQCLDRKIADLATLEQEVAVWEADHNALATTVIWTFTVENARARMPHVYPALPHADPVADPFVNPT